MNFAPTSLGHPFGTSTLPRFPAATTINPASRPSSLVQAAAKQGITGGALPAPTGYSAPSVDVQDTAAYAPNLTHTIETTQAPDGTSTKTTTATAPPTPPAPPPPDPRDAQYYQTYAQNHAKATQAINELNLTDSQDLGNMSEAIRQLIERHPDDIRNLDNSENARGGYFTGNRNTLQGNLERDYVERQTGLRTAYGNAHAARALQAQGINNQLPIDDNQSLLDAVARQLANPAIAGTTTTAPTPAKPAMTPQQKAAAKFAAAAAKSPLFTSYRQHG